jgi:hypothetical protein
VNVFYSALPPTVITNLYLTGAGLYLSRRLDPNDPGQLLLTYPMGMLQSASTLTGSYTDVPGASLPYSLPMNGA